MIAPHMKLCDKQHNDRVKLDGFKKKKKIELFSSSSPLESIKCFKSSKQNMLQIVQYSYVAKYN